jgi:hypothetical protein
MNNFFKTGRECLVIILSISILNFILEAYYVYFISDNFSYMGYILDFNVLKYIEAKILFLFFLILSLRIYNLSKFMYSIYILLIFFFFIPNSIIFSFSDKIRGPLYSVSILLIVFFLFSHFKIKITSIKATPVFKYLLFTFIIILLTIPILNVFKLNINFKTLIFKEIYETRALYSKLSAGFIDYLYNWEAKVIIPIAIVFFLMYKKYFIAGMSFLILIYFYLLSGNKAVYLTTFTTLFFFYIGNDYLKKTKYFLYILIGAYILIPCVDFLLNDFILRGIFVNRLLFFPSLLNYYYFDFFQDHNLYFSENHLFNFFNKSPYDVNSAIIISRKYFHTNEMYANNGLISDGYMNLGYLGVLILSVIFSTIFMFFNSFDIDEKFFGVFFILIFFVVSTPLLTVVSTGGVWLVLIFSFYMTKKKIENQII